LIFHPADERFSDRDMGQTNLVGLMQETDRSNNSISTKLTAYISSGRNGSIYFSLLTKKNKNEQKKELFSVQLCMMHDASVSSPVVAPKLHVCWCLSYGDDARGATARTQR
jgi:hypothetical protein